MIKCYYVLKGESVTLNCGVLHWNELSEFNINGKLSFSLLFFIFQFLIISLRYAIFLINSCYDEYRYNEITVFCSITRLLVICKVLCTTSSSSSAIASFETTMCRGRTFTGYSLLVAFTLYSLLVTCYFLLINRYSLLFTC